MDRSPTLAPLRSRRRHPRFSIDGVFVAQDLSLGHLVRMRDVSLGGFRTEAACPVAPGSVHTFRVHHPDGEACIMRATAIHCHPVVGPRSVCVVGWQAATDVTTARSLERLVTTFSGVESEAPAVGV